MRKLFYLLSFILFILSLTKSAKTSKDDMKKTDMKPLNDVDFMDAMVQCNETFRIETAFIQALNESGSFPDETDRTPKCFLRCVLETTGIATEDGQYDVDHAATVLQADSRADLRAMGRTCAARTEACKCERAYQFMKCLMQLEIQNSEKKQ